MQAEVRESVVPNDPIARGTWSRPALASSDDPSLNRAAGEPASLGRRPSPPPLPNTQAAGQAMRAYWAASAAAFRYQKLAGQAGDARERHALAELQRAEDLHRETIRRVLAEAWDVHLGAVLEGGPIPWPVADHLR
jgi:hypothetical protein